MRAEKRPFHREVKNDAAAGRHAGDELDSRVKRGTRKIGRDAEPGEERRSVFVESPPEPSRPRSDCRSKSTAANVISLGIAMPASRKLRAFPFLRRGMIHFEDVQSGGSEWIAVGERVESSAQHDVLTNAAFARPSELILRITAAHSEERAQRPREGRAGIGPAASDSRSGDGDRQRIVENSAAHPGAGGPHGAGRHVGPSGWAGRPAWVNLLTQYVPRRLGPVRTVPLVLPARASTAT